ncbi:putative transcription factor Nin-like family [Helianthus annuus]|nr:putative transcription factor Nin-like family [Helianthus annuus]
MRNQYLGLFHTTFLSLEISPPHPFHFGHHLSIHQNHTSLSTLLLTVSQQSQLISDMFFKLELPEFLQLFSPISLHHWEPKSKYNPWVFWRESEGCENNSSSPDLATTPMFHEIIKSALSNMQLYCCFFVQFWAPVTIDSRRLLSTSHQPFAFTFPLSANLLMYFVIHTVEAIKRAGLDLFYVQHLIPYKAISGLEVAKDEIEEALKVVCQSHNLALAQVWIPYEDKFSYSLEETQTKRLLAIKLTGYLYAVTNFAHDRFDAYLRFGDVIPRAIEEELLLVTLQDYKSRYISKPRSNKLIGWHYWLLGPPCALAICLRSNDTGDFNYAFEFIWTKHSNEVILLEDILLTLKRCLPRFKFASGAELGDELEVILVDSSTDDETQKLKIFQEKRSSLIPAAPEKGKSPTVMELIAPSEVTCKTTPKVLPRELIEKHFGKTMKEAAKDLNVSLSTLKRKVKELKIPEWPGPNVVKRNRNDLSIIQMNTMKKIMEQLRAYQLSTKTKMS